MAKQRTEIEVLLVWAYRDELPKRDTSSAEGIWDIIAGYGARGGVSLGGHGAAQRYAHYGLPHPDALAIERAVARLPDAAIDWDTDAEPIMGELLVLVDPRSRRAEPRRSTTVRWRDRCGYRDGLETDASWGNVAHLRPPRDVMLVRTLRTAALVTMHARMGSRPCWQEEPPRPRPVIGERGQPRVDGHCQGRNRYTAGSHCPLVYEPSPISIAEARADYVAWWRGLAELADTLDLDDHVATAPAAAEMPWRNPEAPSRVWHLGGSSVNPKPLTRSQAPTPPRTPVVGRPPPVELRS